MGFFESIEYTWSNAVSAFLVCACIVGLLAWVRFGDHKRAWLAVALVSGLAFVLYPAGWHSLLGHGDEWLKMRYADESFRAMLDQKPFRIPTMDDLWWAAQIRFYVTFGLLAVYGVRRWWDGDPLW